jgi:hypothetical protein
VPEDRDPRLAEALAHGLDQLVEIGDELLDRHRRSRDCAVKRLAGAALVPVDDGEDLLERRVEVTEERRLGQPRTAVQQDQRRAPSTAAMPATCATSRRTRACA